MAHINIDKYPEPEELTPCNMKLFLKAWLDNGLADITKDDAKWINDAYNFGPTHANNLQAAGIYRRYYKRVRIGTFTISSKRGMSTINR